MDSQDRGRGRHTMCHTHSPYQRARRFNSNMADSSKFQFPKCSTLFLTEDGSPMIFYMIPCSMKTKLRPLIDVSLFKEAPTWRLAFFSRWICRISSTRLQKYPLHRNFETMFNLIFFSWSISLSFLYFIYRIFRAWHRKIIFLALKLLVAACAL